MRSVACFVGLILASILGGAPDAFGQPKHEEIRKSLVYLHAKGQVAKGANASQWMETYATGFLVSPDGLILTVYHLISQLGDVVPDTVSIEARIREANAPPYSAAIVDGATNIDLMLLKIPPAPQPYTPVVLGSALDHEDTKPIYTSGFSPSGTQVNYRGQQQYIQARDGRGGYLWRTGFTFDAGESGSPIYDDRADVIGLVKGMEGTSGYIVPMHFADSLLAQVRLRKIQEAMKDFEVLRKQFDWSGEVVQRQPGKRVVTITYEKRAGGAPLVRSIDLKVRLHATTKAGEPTTSSEFQIPNIPQTATLGELGGVFEIADLAERVQRLQQDLDYAKVNLLEVFIAPTLTDNSPPLRTRKINIDYQ
jgi:hypothetical protein